LAAQYRPVARSVGNTLTDWSRRAERAKLWLEGSTRVSFVQLRTHPHRTTLSNGPR
jgi:hypothetical protein